MSTYTILELKVHKSEFEYQFFFIEICIGLLL